MYVYIRTEPQLFTVGFFEPNGDWQPDSDWGTREEAAQRVHYLNGGQPPMNTESYTESGTDQEFSDRMNQDMRY